MNEYRCDQCGQTYRRFPSQVHGARRFCSRACQGAYASLHRTGTSAAHWMGGVRRDGARVKWLLPWHRLADKRGYVYRYQIVAELKLGRPLLRGEVVHHLDGDEANDHPDNLEVLPSQAEHARRHGHQRTGEQMAAMRAAKRRAA